MLDFGNYTFQDICWILETILSGIYAGFWILLSGIYAGFLILLSGIYAGFLILLSGIFAGFFFGSLGSLELKANSFLCQIISREIPKKLYSIAKE